MTEIERAAAIVKAIEPSHRPDTSCMLMASAIAGMRGLTMKHIRIGALFWPEKFDLEHPTLSMRGGWGVASYSPADKKLYLSETTVDDDGGFDGHTWLEPEPDTVIDLMHDNEESMREIYGADFKVIGRYIPRPALERAVKKFWRKQMLAAIKAGAKSVSIPREKSDLKRVDRHRISASEYDDAPEITDEMLSRAQIVKGDAKR